MKSVELIVKRLYYDTGRSTFSSEIMQELVRCKDCKYSVDSGEKNILGEPVLICRVDGVYSEPRLKYPSGYCDEGKRKD